MQIESLEKIGEGTYGVVYKGVDKATGDVYALKKIRLESEEEGVPCTAIREICLLKSLKHNHIVRLYDIIHTEKKLTLVFEYIEQDLKQYLDQNGLLDLATIQSFMYQLLQAVEFCHSKNVLHRDLKPQNLLISKKKELKLADFGLARCFGIPGTGYTHEIVTLWYRAPELLLGAQHYSTPVDMWSIGCIMAEMVTGYPLFPGKTDVSQLAKIFEVLGTPTPKNFPSMTKYPYYSKLSKNYNFQGNSKNKVKFPKFDLIGKHGLDLLQKLLQFEPSQRVSAHDALNHAFFRSSSQ